MEPMYVDELMLAPEPQPKLEAVPGKMTDHLEVFRLGHVPLRHAHLGDR